MNLFNWAVEHLLSNEMNAFKNRGSGGTGAVDTFVKMVVRGKSSYCVAPGMIRNEEGETEE